MKCDMQNKTKKMYNKILQKGRLLLFESDFLDTYEECGRLKERIHHCDHCVYNPDMGGEQRGCNQKECIHQKLLEKAEERLFYIFNTLEEGMKLYYRMLGSLD